MKHKEDFNKSLKDIVMIEFPEINYIIIEL